MLPIAAPAAAAPAATAPVTAGADPGSGISDAIATVSFSGISVRLSAAFGAATFLACSLTWAMVADGPLCVYTACRISESVCEDTFTVPCDFIWTLPPVPDTAFDASVTVPDATLDAAGVVPVVSATAAAPVNAPAVAPAPPATTVTTTGFP